MLTVSVLERCSQILIINLRRHLRKNQYERLEKEMKKEWMHNNIKGQYGNYYLFNIPIIFLL